MLNQGAILWATKGVDDLRSRAAKYDRTVPRDRDGGMADGVDGAAELLTESLITNMTIRGG